MTQPPDPARFAKLDFEGFRELALEEGLSRFERIGFPNEYRQGHEEAIFRDILRKLPALVDTARTVLDIGPGCSDLPHMLVSHCMARQHTLVLVDSPAMLDRISVGDGCIKVPGMFPRCMDALAPHRGHCAAVLCYSVLQYAYVDTNLFEFVDQALSLLAPGGTCLIGDVPNLSMRKRFFASETGIRFHQAFTGTSEQPVVRFNVPEPGQIDDAVVLALLQRARAAGFQAYVVPQASELPMANRREDLIFVKP